MATLSLSEVTNTYGTYRGNSLVGERGNVGTVPNNGLEGINGVNYPFLSNLIVVINGASYTYSGYLNQLKLQGNPYISKQSLPTVEFTLDQLVNDPIPDTEVYEMEASGSASGSVFRTQYAESQVTKKMSTIDDVLFYLNDFFNPKNSDDILIPSSFGSWALNTTSYDVDLDVVGLYPGLEFEELGEALAIKPSTPPTKTESKPPPPEPIVNVEPPKEINIVSPPIEEIKETPIQIGPETPDPFTRDPFSDIIDPIGFAINTRAQNLSGLQSGNTYGSAPTGRDEVIKPLGAGRFTGEQKRASDGSNWVWIPGLGGWTSA
jgi:hypothetical protein